jgi:hypothetical protein
MKYSIAPSHFFDRPADHSPLSMELTTFSSPRRPSLGRPEGRPLQPGSCGLKAGRYSRAPAA